MTESPTEIQPLHGKSTTGLAILAIFATVAMILSLVVIQIAHFLRNANMDYEIFYQAAMALRTGEDIFAPVLIKGGAMTYIYPPFLAVLFVPLTFIPLEQSAATFTIINGILIGACLWFGGREVLRRSNGRLDKATLPVIICITTAFMFPRIKAELDQGQTDMIVLLGMTLSLIWIRRYPWLAGIALGLVANIKYQTVIFVPYFLFRQWWSVVGGFVVGAVAAAFSGALLIGWERNLEYLKRAFGGMAEMIGLPVDAESLPAIAPVDWIGSISATSTSARWSESLGMGTGVFLFFVGVVALVCLLLGWWCYRAHGQRLFAQRGGVSGRQDPENDPLVLFEWLGLMTAALAFGPQTKLRHMIIIIPVSLIK